MYYFIFHHVIFIFINRYEEIVKETCTACGTGDNVTVPNTSGLSPQTLTKGRPTSGSQASKIILNRVEEEAVEDELSSNDRSNTCEIVMRSIMPEDEDQDSGKQANRSLSSRERHCVISEAANNSESFFLSESES